MATGEVAAAPPTSLCPIPRAIYAHIGNQIPFVIHSWRRYDASSLRLMLHMGARVPPTGLRRLQLSLLLMMKAPQAMGVNVPQPYTRRGHGACLLA